MAEVNFLVKKGLTVPKGSAATPSVIFDASDPDTGLYSPGANQRAISTNGTGRLFVDSSGTVLAKGTERLAFNTYVSDSNHAGYFGRDTSTGALVIEAQNAGGGYPITFRTSSQERARIDDQGRLGLGTSSPQTLLNLRAASGNAILRLENSNTTVGAGEALGAVEWYSNDSSTGGTAVAAKINVVDENGFGTAYGMGFYTGSVSGGSYALSERVRIDETGRVGVGTATPGQALDVVGSIRSRGSVNPVFTLNDGTIESYFQIVNSNTAVTAGGANSLAFNVNSGERARITSSGQLLVGTSSAQGSAILQTDSTTLGFLPPRMTTAQRDAISSPAAGLMVYNTSTNKLNFYNGSAWEAVTSA